MTHQTTKYDVQTPNLAKDPQKPTKAYVDVIFGGFMHKGVRIIKGEKGFFVSMPSQVRKREGKEVLDEKGAKQYDDHYYPVSKEIRDQFEAAVLAAFNAKVESEKAFKASNAEKPQPGAQ